MAVKEGDLNLGGSATRGLGITSGGPVADRAGHHLVDGAPRWLVVVGYGRAHAVRLEPVVEAIEPHLARRGRRGGQRGGRTAQAA